MNIKKSTAYFNRKKKIVDIRWEKFSPYRVENFLTNNNQKITLTYVDI